MRPVQRESPSLDFAVTRVRDRVHAFWTHTLVYGIKKMLINPPGFLM